MSSSSKDRLSRVLHLAYTGRRFGSRRMIDRKMAAFDGKVLPSAMGPYLTRREIL